MVQNMVKKTLFLIGRTGSGKSALANILVNKEENFKEGGKFEEIFKEGKYSVSETKDIQVEQFELEEKELIEINKTCPHIHHRFLSILVHRMPRQSQI